MSLATRTITRGLDSIVAIVALEGAVPLVIGEGHTAVRAFKRQAAVRAEDKMGKSPSVKKEKALPLFLEIFLEARLQLGRKNAFLPFHVHNFHFWKGLSLDPLRETQEAKLSFFGIME
jgi:hypothetical protein